MSENDQQALKLLFDRRLRLESHGARTTSDAGLLAGGALNGIDGHVARSYHWPQRGRACEPPYNELIWEIPTK
jgi:hypothetical protein